MKVSSCTPKLPAIGSKQDTNLKLNSVNHAATNGTRKPNGYISQGFGNSNGLISNGIGKLNCSVNLNGKYMNINDSEKLNGKVSTPVNGTTEYTKANGSKLQPESNCTSFIEIYNVLIELYC